MVKINSSIKKQLYRIIYWQLAIVLGLASVFLLITNIQKGFSVALGGLAYWIPTVIFLLWVSRYAGARAMIKFILAFFVGEMIKLILSGALFLFMIKYFSMNLFYGLLGLITAIVGYWVASVAMLYHQENKV